jgi:cadmium resistance protein CadD (predicted permease)
MTLLPPRDRTLRVGLCLLNLAAAGELAWILNDAVGVPRASATSPTTHPALGVFIAAVAVLIVLSLFFAGVAFRPPSRQQLLTTTANALVFSAAAACVFAATVLYSSASGLASVMAIIPFAVGVVVCVTQRAAVKRALAGSHRTSQSETFLVYCVPDSQAS